MYKSRLTLPRSRKLFKVRGGVLLIPPTFCLQNTPTPTSAVDTESELRLDQLEKLMQRGVGRLPKE